jgi:putative endonuclease
MARHNELGEIGEQAAVEYLQKHGHQILARNYRFGKGEIDIISKDADCVVFVEVKTRSTEYFGYPEQAIDKKKISLLKSVAEEYIYQFKVDGPVRFDIISIVAMPNTNKVYHIKDAFFYQPE